MSEAMKFFKAQPGYLRTIASMQADLEAMHRGATPQEQPYGSSSRIDYVIRCLDRRAQAFLELVSNVPGLEAYESVLGDIGHAAWEEYTGWPVDRLQPLSARADGVMTTILARVQHWVREAYQRAAAEQSEAEAKVPSKGQAVTTLTIMTWDELKIFFLSDFQIEIGNGKITEVRNCEELGFVDRRSHLPNGLWKVLRSLAESEGRLDKPDGLAADWAPLEKQIERLRKRLRQYFELSEDPLPSNRGAGYRARFAIGCRPSYYQ